MSGRIVTDKGEELPEDINKLAWLRYDRHFDANTFARTECIRDMFDWYKTEEGKDFWRYICDGDFSIYYNRYGETPKLIDNYSII